MQVPKTAGHDGEPFYPQSLERGRRSVRAVMLAVAEMYIKGVSTRGVEAVMAEFGIESLSSSQVSRAAKLLDEELQAWRDRPLGEIKYLILDARYEKMRHGGIVRDGEEERLCGILCSGAFCYAIGKRFSNMMASWLFTACHSRTERFHSTEVALSAR